MLCVKQLVLDVLKPHHPDVVEFACAIAAKGLDYCVQLTVVEMDDKTETLQIAVTGADLQLDSIVTAIHEMGGSLHSIDGVKVVNKNDA